MTGRTHSFSLSSLSEKVMVCENTKELELEMELKILRDYCKHPNLPEYYGAFVNETPGEGILKVDHLWMVMEVK